MEDEDKTPRRKVYRLSFDFNTPLGMQEFFDGLVRDWMLNDEGGDERDRVMMVMHDSLHDTSRSVHAFHVRRSANGGNGREVRFEEAILPSEVVMTVDGVEVEQPSAD